MPCRLHWKSSLSASCLHAALCDAEGLPPADPTLRDVLGIAIEALAGQASALGYQPRRLLAELTSYASEVENNRDLVVRALSRQHGPTDPRHAHVGLLAGCIADLEAAMLRHQPELAEELALRGNPLREQWEARGPGMLRSLLRLTDEGIVPPQAEIVLAAPYAGGHGRAFVLNNRCLVEALLYHPAPEVPETLRVGWLASQLNIDVPRYADCIPPGKAARVGALALAPAALAAGEAVEWAQCDPHALALANGQWRLGLSGEAVDALWHWWEAYRDSATRWPVALAALAEMLEPLGALDC